MQIHGKFDPVLSSLYCLQVVTINHGTRSLCFLSRDHNEDFGDKRRCLSLSLCKGKASCRTNACPMVIQPCADMMELVSLEDIDLSLRDAHVCKAELEVLDVRLNKPETNDDERKRIEVRTAILFMEMMSASYTVLDQCYYYLYCHFQNDGNPSFHNAAFHIKTPVGQNLMLKQSEDATQDSKQEGSVAPNDFVNKKCVAIFGNDCFNGKEKRNLRRFQVNLLRLQVITKVDEHGALLKTCFEHNQCQDEQCPDKAPKLFRAQEITHPSGHESHEPDSFHPTLEELKSVKDIDSWNETTIFHLLHFFRNFTTHRALIHCPTKGGYLNLKTREFKAEREEGAGDDWIKIAKCAQIFVPEISHLKDKGREAPPRFHQHPLLKVCSKILSFVKDQRSLLLEMTGYHKSPITVSRSSEDGLVFMRNNKRIGDCNWNDYNGFFRLWPVEKKSRDNLQMSSKHYDLFAELC